MLRCNLNNVIIYKRVYQCAYTRVCARLNIADEEVMSTTLYAKRTEYKPIDFFYRGVAELKTKKIKYVDVYQILNDRFLGRMSACNYFFIAENSVRINELNVIGLDEIKNYHLVMRENFYIPEKITYFFNTTTRFIDNQRDYDILLQTLSENKYSKQDLVLTFNANTVSELDKDSRLRLQNLRRKGFKICINGFGEFYNSLDLFADFKFDFIRLEASYFDATESKKKVLKMIVRHCSAEKIILIMEGVDTPSQMTRFKKEGIKLATGRAISPLSRYVTNEFLNLAELTDEQKQKYNLKLQKELEENAKADELELIELERISVEKIKAETRSGKIMPSAPRPELIKSPYQIRLENQKQAAKRAAGVQVEKETSESFGNVNKTRSSVGGFAGETVYDATTHKYVKTPLATLIINEDDEETEVVEQKIKPIIFPNVKPENTADEKDADIRGEKSDVQSKLEQIEENAELQLSENDNFDFEEASINLQNKSANHSSEKDTTIKKIGGEEVFVETDESGEQRNSAKAEEENFADFQVLQDDEENLADIKEDESSIEDREDDEQDNLSIFENNLDQGEEIADELSAMLKAESLKKTLAQKELEEQRLAKVRQKELQLQEKQEKAWAREQEEIKKLQEKSKKAKKVVADFDKEQKLLKEYKSSNLFSQVGVFGQPDGFGVKLHIKNANNEGETLSGQYDDKGRWVDEEGLVYNGYFDEDGKWKDYEEFDAKTEGHYDEEGRWVDGDGKVYNGYFDENNRWIDYSFTNDKGEEVDNGYFDSKISKWIPFGYFDENGKYIEF